MGKRNGNTSSRRKENNAAFLLFVHVFLESLFMYFLMDKDGFQMGVVFRFHYIK